VLVETSPGLIARQRQRLHDCPLPLRWCSFAELAAAPVRGLVLAHEVLDALAVARIVWDGERWWEQGVALIDAGAGPLTLQLVAAEPLDPALEAWLQPPSPLAEHLGPLDRRFPGERRPAGWCTELHPGLAPWLAGCAAALAQGPLLVIDYAHEAHRYYAPQRSNGTLMAYRAQQASSDPLRDPGQWDLTAHLCLESLERAATAAGWSPIGSRRQGEALLALGLAQRLHGLQHSPQLGDQGSLPELLRRREALLRLVDPAALGDFRWIAFERCGAPAAPAPGHPCPLFLQDPPLL
jgi:SAM-dependent MidA family methyltransferase